MLYKEPFVLYLNISVCIILLFLVLPSLLNRREELKVRLAFSCIFFVVIATCLINLAVLHTENYQWAFVGYFVFFISFLFGPLIYYYVKSLLGSNVTKTFYLSLIPGLISIAYGIELGSADVPEKQKTFQQMLAGNHLLYNTLNQLTLVLTLIYCVKAWFFVKKNLAEKKEQQHATFKLKAAWAKEFIIYMFANVFVFLILTLVLTMVFDVNMVDMDLIGMPVFILFVYLLVAVRSMMMYKDFEHQFELANIENEKQIQAQRLELSKDLHDSLGAQLTFINSILDGLKNASSKPSETINSKIHLLSDLSENSITELKNTLWVLSSNDIHLADFKAKMLNFMKSASEVKEAIKFDFNFDYSRNLKLASKQAVNLFRALQEIINNALKYADATAIKIDVRQNEQMLTINISDNGKGFDYENEKTKSFGLRNIESRIAAIDGILSLETVAGNGTKYVIQIELEHD